MKVRILTDEGTNLFKEYLSKLKLNSNIEAPNLNLEPYSLLFIPDIEIDESIRFESRMHMGNYLVKLFEKVGLRREDLLNRNIGLFNWLAYLYLDEICPLRNGTRKVRETARYICSSSYTDYYRHYIAATYDIYSVHGDESSLFLNTPPYEHNDFMEQVASRQYIISYHNLIKVLNYLYLDSSTKKPKKSSSDRNKPGNLRRFIKLCEQLELTYDIYSIQPNELTNKLPYEFKRWKDT